MTRTPGTTKQSNTPAGFTRIGPSVYADAATGRFIVSRNARGWKWYDRNDHTGTVCGPRRATRREALLDIEAYDAQRPATDILAGWAALGGRS